jgi:lipopolysaccharide export system permease protein
MRILDRQRYWSFFKAYVICFVSLVGLYVVIDAFSNLDEFAEVATGVQLFYNMGRYYLIKMSLIYDQICGVITQMAAIFTVTWLQRNNELLAMLAAGISTKRVIRPVLISAIAISSLAVMNQELIMPRLGEELEKPPDDDGIRKVKAYNRYDSNDIFFEADLADRSNKIITKYHATLPISIASEIIELQSREARYIPEDETNLPLRGGWLIRGAQFPMTPSTKALETLTHGILTPVDDPSLYPPPLDPVLARPGMPTYFLKSSLTFTAITRSRHWYHYATTIDLIRGLSDPSNAGDRVDMLVFLHARIIRPLLSVTLMLMSLPLVLGGMGRNMFINLGLSLGTSGVFYAANFLFQYLGGHEVLTPELAAWAPLILFGSFAAARWDTIRT